MVKLISLMTPLSRGEALVLQDELKKKQNKKPLR